MAILENDDQELPKTNQSNLKSIDINDSSLLEGDEREIDPSANAFDSIAPPPDGCYKLKLFEAKDCYQVGATDKKEVYYVANLECKLISDDPKLGGRTLFAKASTYIGQGKNISQMETMLVKMGVKVPTKSTPLALVRMFKRALAKEPCLYGEGEWKAWDMHKEEWIKQGMTRFPKTEDQKGYHHRIRDSKGGEVTAKWKILRWYGLKEWVGMLEKKKQQKATGAVATGGGNKPPVKSEEVVEEVGGFQEINNVEAATTTTAVKDDDFMIDEG